MKNKILYHRTNRRGITIFLKTTKGERKYPEKIKKQDKLILIGIKKDNVELTTAYSFNDQIEMWKKVYEVQILPSSKKKIINKIKALLQELEGNNKQREFNFGGEKGESSRS